MDRSRAVRDLQSQVDALLESIERHLAELRATEEPQDLIAEVDGLVIQIRTQLFRYGDQESSPLK